ncbi:hypothetical protein UFOVP116_30 [uncultured Caudovirales phage]|uniref:Uncharacterized protein n=1 Tax=uncultured Caudovirales phage TaxID=2100421 RepID=A0A6J5L9K2_9CAUD|nr:hypothetical protein UFOVP116_30 [uncultured Caudovirales phage]
MATKNYSNLQYSSTSGDPTTFLSQFTSSTYSITENELMAITAYFEKKADNKAAAASLTMAVISGAIAQNLKPMEVLDQFKQMSTKQLDSYLAYFLNSNRYPTSLLGINNNPTASKYVSRSIVP